jgi:hypothetical protein
VTDILDFFGANHADKIEVRGAQFCVTSEDGETELGCYDSEDEANERLRQVEAAVAAKGDSSHRVDRVDYLGRIRFTDASIEIEIEPHEFEAKLTPEGFLKIDGHISGTGVYDYSDGDETWGELRTADEVFNTAALDSFRLAPVTDDHPSEMVSSDNIKDVQAGHLGSDVRPHGDNVRADMLITDADLIAKIKDGKAQLSCGYSAVVTPTEGTTDDGVSYSAIQSEIRGNHLAVVDLARGGPTCRLLLDSKDGAFSARNIEMKVKKKDGAIMLGETEHEVPDEVATAFDAMRAKMEEQAAELAKLSTDAEGDEEKSEDESDDENKDEEIEVEMKEEDNKGDALAAMQAKVDSLLAERETVSSKIDARVSLVVKTREILGSDAKTDGVSDINLMRAVVAQVSPAMKAKVDAGSPDYVSAAYEMALGTQATKVDSTTELLTLTHEAIKSDGDVDLDGLYSAHLDHLRTRSLVVREAN